MVKDKNEIIKKIKNIAKRHNLQRVFIFGSFARQDDFSDDSDIDILIELPSNSNIGLFEFSGITLDFQEILGRKVDLGEINSIRPEIKPYVEKDIEVVYEK